MDVTACTLKIDDVLSFDVVVVGGGMAGICAAIAAARNGCRTALVEMDPCLGGNGGPLLGVHISGAHSFHPYASETGIIEELELEAARQRGKTRTWGQHYNISPQWEQVLVDTLSASGVHVFCSHQGRRAITEGRRVTGVVALDVEHFRTRLFRIEHALVDASGDGIVACDAGATFMRGTEAHDAFGERSAPEQANAATMGTSITALVRRCREPVSFVMPTEFAGRARAEGPPPGLRHYPSSWHPDAEFCFLWVTESGGERDTVADAAAIRHELLYQLYRTWDNVKNNSFAEAARNWELTWVSPKSGKRESRRFMGDYVLTQTDVEGICRFADSIGYGGYGVDVHEPLGTRTKIVFHSIPPLWSFPYRSCYSRDFDNLWLAGRLMSVSHLALGTVRLMRTLAAIGQGVGVAIALAHEFGCTAADVGQRHIERLQQTLLAQDGTILTVVNRDPLDLARLARVTASSDMCHGAERVSSFLSLDCRRGVQLWDWAERFEFVTVRVRNTGPQIRRLVLRLQLHEEAHSWKEDGCYSSFEHLRGRSAANRMEWGCENGISDFTEVATAAATVPAGFDDWLEFRFVPGLPAVQIDQTSDRRRYNMLLDPCADIAVGVDSHWYDFALRLWRLPDGDRYEVAGDCHAFRLDPAPTYGEASNVINGHNRRYSTNPVNAWLSDVDLPLPQDLMLTWDEPQTVARVHLTFDTIERAYRDSPINADEPYAKRCVSGYRLEALMDDIWQVIVDTDDNCQRHRVHRFAPVQTRSLRLTVNAVRDPTYRARLYEIRAYASG